MINDKQLNYALNQIAINIGLAIYKQYNTP